MIKIKNSKHCSGCMACVHACPNAAVAPTIEKGFLYPRVDTKKCDDCGKCEAVCPYLHPIPSHRGESAYIAYTDEAVRESSSAGGVFAILALRTLARGGVVFGAAYKDDLTCEHRYIEDADGIEVLMGRKYVESALGDSYLRVKDFLLAEREVLFSGTPCQIAGLKNFLGAPYPGLLTVEVGCGGVAGEDVWRSFLEYMDDPCGIEITNRVDEENRAAIRFVYKNGEERLLARKDTAVHKAITQGLGIRPSCEGCVLDKKKSCADVTLRRYNPALDDNGLNIRRQPMTLVLCRNAAGSAALAQSSALLNIREISKDDAYRHMARADKDKRFAERSGAFIRALETRSFAEALEKYSKNSYLYTVFRAIRSIFVK